MMPDTSRASNARRHAATRIKRRFGAAIRKAGVGKRTWFSRRRRNATKLQRVARSVTIGRRIAAEFVGTAFLVLAVVGSGIVAERLCGDNGGLALLANAVATGGALVALILAFGSISGAHFNPS